LYDFPGTRSAVRFALAIELLYATADKDQHLTSGNELLQLVLFK